MYIKNTKDISSGFIWGYIEQKKLVKNYVRAVERDTHCLIEDKTMAQYLNEYIIQWSFMIWRVIITFFESCYILVLREIHIHGLHNHCVLFKKSIKFSFLNQQCSTHEFELHKSNEFLQRISWIHQLISWYSFWLNSAIYH